MTITSLSNATVKLLASLRLEKYREAHGLFMVEGARMIADGLKAGTVPQVLAMVADATGADSARLNEAARACRAAGGTVVSVSPDVMRKIAHKDNPQPAVAAVARVRRGIATLRPEDGDLFIALDRVRDPGNLGTIIRTAQAVGAGGVLLVGPACDPTSPECIRATTGSIFHVPVLHGSEAEFVALAARWPGSVVGTAADGAVHYGQAAYKAPVLLVLGTEQSGMSDAVARACGLVARIPMRGASESLNLSVAAGLMLYAARDAL